MSKIVDLLVTNTAKTFIVLWLAFQALLFVIFATFVVLVVAGIIRGALNANPAKTGSPNLTEVLLAFIVSLLAAILFLLYRMRR